MLKLYFALDSNDEIFVINCSVMEKCLMLDGADVFKQLLGITNDRFADVPLKTDEEGRILLFRDLDISKTEWMYLNHFLNHGRPQFDCYSWEQKCSLMENINWTASKLGGVPCFDVFYRTFYEKNKQPIFNPKCPDDDEFDRYHWVLENFPNRSLRTASKEWSATRHFRMGITDFVWWRREKK
jgi:hypothetical protein